MQKNIDVRLGEISCDDLPLEENVGNCAMEWLLSETSARLGFSANKTILTF